MHRIQAFPDIREMLRRLVIAVFIGLASALVVWLFRQAMNLLENVFLGDHGGSLVAAAAALEPWRRVLTPAAGGLLAGLLLWRWQRATRQRPSAPTDYMEAIETGDGRLDVPSSLVKSAASLIVVASGSAIGREGAMILLATVFASLFAQRFTPDKEWKLWVAWRGRSRDGERLSCAAGGQPVYCGNFVWLTDACLAGAGGDCRRQRPADDAFAERRARRRCIS